MSHDRSRRSKWSHEQVENSNAIDRFFGGAYSLVILVVPILITCSLDYLIDIVRRNLMLVTLGA